MPFSEVLNLPAHVFQLSMSRWHIIGPNEGLNLRSNDLRLQRAYFVAHKTEGGKYTPCNSEKQQSPGCQKQKVQSVAVDERELKKQIKSQEN